MNPIFHEKDSLQYAIVISMLRYRRNSDLNDDLCSAYTELNRLVLMNPDRFTSQCRAIKPDCVSSKTTPKI